MVELKRLDICLEEPTTTKKEIFGMLACLNKHSNTELELVPSDMIVENNA